MRQLARVRVPTGGPTRSGWRNDGERFLGKNSRDHWRAPGNSGGRRTLHVAQLRRQAPCEVVQPVTAVRLEKTGRTQQRNDGQLHRERVLGEAPFPAAAVVVVVVQRRLRLRVIRVGLGGGYLCDRSGRFGLAGQR